MFQTPIKKSGPYFRTHLKVYFLLVLFGLCTSISYAQNSIYTPTSFHTKLHFNDTDTTISYLNHFSDDFVYLVHVPFKWKHKEWLLFTGVIGGTGLLFHYDEPLFTYINDRTKKINPKWGKYLFEPLGDTKYQLGGLALLYGSGALMKNEEMKTVSMLAFESLIMTGVATNFIKYATGRARPYENSAIKSNTWNGLGGSSSFWSGHTATAFSLASVFAGIYKDKVWVGVTSYTLATAAGISRIIDEKHWPSDVVFGAIAGTFIGNMVVRNYHRKTLQFIPYLNSEATGVTLSYKF